MQFSVHCLRRHYHHHHHVSVMGWGRFLTRSGLMYPQVSSKVCHNSFCQLGNSVSLFWVLYYEAFYLYVVSSFSCIPVICPILVLFLIPLQFVYLFCTSGVQAWEFILYFNKTRNASSASLYFGDIDYFCKGLRWCILLCTVPVMILQTVPSMSTKSFPVSLQDEEWQR